MCEPLEQAYKNCFSAIEEYNLKQKRADRRIDAPLVYGTNTQFKNGEKLLKRRTKTNQDCCLVVTVGDDR